MVSKGEGRIVAKAMGRAQHTTEMRRVLPSTLRLILSFDCPGMSALTCGWQWSTLPQFGTGCQPLRRGRCEGRVWQGGRERNATEAHLVVVWELRSSSTLESVTQVSVLTSQSMARACQTHAYMRSAMVRVGAPQLGR